MDEHKHEWKYGKVKWYEPQDTNHEKEHICRMRECQCGLKELEFEGGNWYYFDAEQKKWLLGGCKHEFNDIEEADVEIKYSGSSMLEDAPIMQLNKDTVVKRVPRRFCHKCGRQELMTNIKEGHWGWVEGTGDGAEE